MSTFRFECKKLRKKKTTWLAFFITIIGIIGFCLFPLSVAEKVHQENIAWMDYLSQMFASSAEEYALEMKKAEEAGDTEKAEEFYNYMVQDQESSEIAKKIKELFLNENWSRLIERDIRSLEPYVEDYDAGGHYIASTKISLFTLRATLEEKNDYKNTISNLLFKVLYMNIFFRRFMMTFPGVRWKSGRNQQNGMKDSAFTFCTSSYNHISFPLLFSSVSFFSETVFR